MRSGKSYSLITHNAVDVNKKDIVLPKNRKSRFVKNMGQIAVKRKKLVASTLQEINDEAKKETFKFISEKMCTRSKSKSPIRVKDYKTQNTNITDKGKAKISPSAISPEKLANANNNLRNKKSELNLQSSLSVEEELRATVKTNNCVRNSKRKRKNSDKNSKAKLSWSRNSMAEENEKSKNLSNNGKTMKSVSPKKANQKNSNRGNQMYSDSNDNLSSSVLEDSPIKSFPVGGKGGKLSAFKIRNKSKILKLRSSKISKNQKTSPKDRIKSVTKLANSNCKSSLDCNSYGNISKLCIDKEKNLNQFEKLSDPDESNNHQLLNSLNLQKFDEIPKKNYVESPQKNKVKKGKLQKKLVKKENEIVVSKPHECEMLKHSSQPDESILNNSQNNSPCKIESEKSKNFDSKFCRKFKTKSTSCNALENNTLGLFNFNEDPSICVSKSDPLMDMNLDYFAVSDPDMNDYLQNELQYEQCLSDSSPEFPDYSYEIKPIIKELEDILECLNCDGSGNLFDVDFFEVKEAYSSFWNECLAESIFPVSNLSSNKLSVYENDRNITLTSLVSDAKLNSKDGLESNKCVSYGIDSNISKKNVTKEDRRETHQLPESIIDSVFPIENFETMIDNNISTSKLQSHVVTEGSIFDSNFGTTVEELKNDSANENVVQEKEVLKLSPKKKRKKVCIWSGTNSRKWKMRRKKQKAQNSQNILLDGPSKYNISAPLLVNKKTFLTSPKKDSSNEQLQDIFLNSESIINRDIPFDNLTPYQEPKSISDSNSKTIVSNIEFSSNDLSNTFQFSDTIAQCNDKTLFSEKNIDVLESLMPDLLNGSLDFDKDLYENLVVCSGMANMNSNDQPKPPVISECWSCLNAGVSNDSLIIHSSNSNSFETENIESITDSELLVKNTPDTTPFLNSIENIKSECLDASSTNVDLLNTYRVVNLEITNLELSPNNMICEVQNHSESSVNVSSKLSTSSVSPQKNNHEIFFQENLCLPKNNLEILTDTSIEKTGDQNHLMCEVQNHSTSPVNISSGYELPTSSVSSQKNNHETHFQENLCLQKENKEILIDTSVEKINNSDLSVNVCSVYELSTSSQSPQKNNHETLFQKNLCLPNEDKEILNDTSVEKVENQNHSDYLVNVSLDFELSTSSVSPKKYNNETLFQENLSLPKEDKELLTDTSAEKIDSQNHSMVEVKNHSDSLVNISSAYELSTSNVTPLKDNRETLFQANSCLSKEVKTNLTGISVEKVESQVVNTCKVDSNLLKKESISNKHLYQTERQVRLREDLELMHYSHGQNRSICSIEDNVKITHNTENKSAKVSNFEKLNLKDQNSSRTVEKKFDNIGIIIDADNRHIILGMNSENYESDKGSFLNKHSIKEKKNNINSVNDKEKETLINDELQVDTEKENFVKEDHTYSNQKLTCPKVVETTEAFVKETPNVKDSIETDSVLNKKSVTHQSDSLSMKKKDIHKISSKPKKDKMSKDISKLPNKPQLNDTFDSKCKKRKKIESKRLSESEILKYHGDKIISQSSKKKKISSDNSISKENKKIKLEPVSDKLGKILSVSSSDKLAKHSSNSNLNRKIDSCDGSKHNSINLESDNLYEQHVYTSNSFNLKNTAERFEKAVTESPVFVESFKMPEILNDCEKYELSPPSELTVLSLPMEGADQNIEESEKNDDVLILDFESEIDVESVREWPITESFETKKTNCYSSKNGNGHNSLSAFKDYWSVPVQSMDESFYNINSNCYTISEENRMQPVKENSENIFLNETKLRKRDYLSDDSDTDCEHSFKRRKKSSNNYELLKQTSYTLAVRGTTNITKNSDEKTVSYKGGYPSKSSTIYQNINNNSTDKETGCISNSLTYGASLNLMSHISNDVRITYENELPQIFTDHGESICSILSAIKTNCERKNFNEALVLAKKYISDSTVNTQKLIVGELHMNIVNCLKAPHIYVESEACEKILGAINEIMNDHNLYDPEFCSDVIINYLQTEYNYFAEDLLTVCKKKGISLRTDAVSMYASYLISKDFCIFKFLFFLEYVKYVCNYPLPNQLLQKVLEICNCDDQFFFIPVSEEFKKLCGLICCINADEVSCDYLQKFIKQCIQNDHWNKIAAFFRAWVKKAKLSHFLCQSLAFPLDESGSCFEKFAAALHGDMNEELPLHHASLFGQMGVLIMMEAFSKGHKKSALEILHILHNYKINYYELQIPAYYLNDPGAISKHIDNPLEVFIFQYTVAFTAVDICLYFNMPKNAFNIFQNFFYLSPDVITNQKLKSHVTFRRFIYLLKLSQLLIVNDPLDRGVDVLRHLLTSAEKDFASEDLADFAEALESVYNQGLINLLNHQKIQPAYEFYNFSKGDLKEVLKLKPPVFRGLVVSLSQNEMVNEAKEMFRVGAFEENIYFIKKPEFNDVPWSLAIKSFWTKHEIKLAIEVYIEILLPVFLLKLGKSDKEGFTVKIKFEEDQTINSEIDCLDECSNRVDVTLKKTCAVLKSLDPEIDWTEETSENYLILQAVTFYNYYKKLTNSDGSTPKFLKLPLLNSKDDVILNTNSDKNLQPDKKLEISNAPSTSSQLPTGLLNNDDIDDQEPSFHNITPSPILFSPQSPISSFNSPSSNAADISQVLKLMNKNAQTTNHHCASYNFEIEETPASTSDEVSVTHQEISVSKQDVCCMRNYKNSDIEYETSPMSTSNFETDSMVSNLSSVCINNAEHDSVDTVSKQASCPVLEESNTKKSVFPIPTKKTVVIKNSSFKAVTENIPSSYKNSNGTCANNENFLEKESSRLCLSKNKVPNFNSKEENSQYFCERTNKPDEVSKSSNSKCIKGNQLISKDESTTSLNPEKQKQESPPAKTIIRYNPESLKATGSSFFYEEEFSKIKHFLKTKILLKYRDLSPEEQNEKVTNLANMFIQENNLNNKLDKRGMKLLSDFSDRNV